MECQHRVAESVELLDEPGPHHLIRAQPLLAGVCPDSRVQVCVNEFHCFGTLVQNLAHCREFACVLMVNRDWNKDALSV